jgi:predicted nucleic acid-binding protein
VTPVVTDASAVVEYLLRTPRATAIGMTIEDVEVSLHVPALCDVEVAAVIRRALLSRRLREDRAHEAITDYLELPLTRHGHAALIARILQLRANFSAYDATYVALAEQLGAVLLTADAGLARAARSHTRLPVRP